MDGMKNEPVPIAMKSFHLTLAGREWEILTTEAILTLSEEKRFFAEKRGEDVAEPLLPYGVTLWAAAIALAQELSLRAEEFRGKSVLELGAGTGLPGLVAAHLGAQVVQSDYMQTIMRVCELNAELNGIEGITYKKALWQNWDDPRQYDVIIGSDILYASEGHADLMKIFQTNLSPRGQILITDPGRPDSLKFLNALQEQGWSISASRYTMTLEETEEERSMGLLEIQPPPSAANAAA